MYDNCLGPLPHVYLIPSIYRAPRDCISYNEGETRSILPLCSSPSLPPSPLVHLVVMETTDACPLCLPLPSSLVLTVSGLGFLFPPDLHRYFSLPSLQLQCVSSHCPISLLSFSLSLSAFEREDN